MGQVRVLCAHRNRLFRQCLLSVLESRAFVATEIDVDQWNYRRLIDDSQPQVVLVDLGLADRQAIELVRYLSISHPEVRIVLLVPTAQLAPRDKQKLMECVEVGVHGYLLEGASLEDLTQAIRQAQEGATFCSPQIVDSLFTEFASLVRDSGWRTRVETSKLTRRELEVLKWVAEGLSNKQVAKQLSVSLYTVKNHVRNILRKLEVKDRGEAVRMAVGQEWLTPVSGYVVSDG